jgi:hypothetical protein
VSENLKYPAWMTACRISEMTLKPCMYVQAVKVNAINRIIVEMDLMNLPKGKIRNYKSMEYRKTEEAYRKRNMSKQIFAGK